MTHREQIQTVASSLVLHFQMGRWAAHTRWENPYSLHSLKLLKTRRDTRPLLPNTCIPSCGLDPPTATLILLLHLNTCCLLSAFLAEELISKSNEGM